ncbi:MerR family transcriptional regulator [Flavobacterium aquatile]|uniref:MerR family transcriptional regulator n=1 Tax=Flavobacterium aquatile LMG 4008 = ATCC 11947 TaxID=1453498 RepID=A0A095V4A1_9FLAO|nr:MerR family transcriptional regulator [Flavobacterium aquatile]KGD69695.1 MerR family transcriptional regulator [Flavobacterium aquatile LMG 4008 = ATCC 11947]OXA67317.1 MerR family transcriptional regulator [Flavobacterium aquatile LMG 4008 = ATCC 11947]
MNNVKNTFSIKDLENLSGIKAHTIRIWEKRYNVLEPMRTDTNIRFYDLNALQKLLNITLLHDYGYKISKISKMPAEKIPELVRDIVSNKSAKNHAISSFKLAMMNFDQNLFFKTYDTLLSEKSFREVFFEVFIPLMEEIGFLWQVDTITPAHEHFISYLIKLKLLVNTEKIQSKEPTRNDKVFVLYLPMNEIHELGLMYLNYEILSQGYKTIYLGESVPTDSLKDIKKYFDNIVYVCYMTVEPEKAEVNDYIKNLKEEILDENSEVWLIGRMTENVDPKSVSHNVNVFNSINQLVENI